jgi:hypothetical protein
MLGLKVAQAFFVRALALSGVIASGLLMAGCTARATAQPGPSLPPGDYTAREAAQIVLSPKEKHLRDAALERAAVWREPAIPIARANLAVNPPAPWGTADEIACRFLPAEARGTTGKFECVLAGGEIIKVKYARSGEIPSELAASRLLRALGFGADEMHLLRRVRCFGCPASPFLTVKALQILGLRDAFAKRIDFNDYAEFEWVAVERRFPAPELRVDGEEKGWAWYELPRVSTEKGGAARREIDGLRLVAALLNHWDNKAENQRLVCIGGWNDRTGCAQPFAFIQDLGANFGPHKPNLRKWSSTRVWADASQCRLSMKHLPYGGATFDDVVVTEEGRRWIAPRLTALTDAQLRDLFSAARFPEHDGASDRDADVQRWIHAFKARVREIADREPCPAT